MSFKSTMLAAVAALFLTAPAFAGDTIMVHDPYIRSSAPTATTGAAFMTLMNTGSQDDRLIAVRSGIAKKVELHTHMESANGVMQMMMIEGGIAIPAGGEHRLMRGADHVMFMGLGQSLTQGETISLTLTFEQAGDVIVEVLVDHKR